MGRLAAHPDELEQLSIILKYSKKIITAGTLTPDTDSGSQFPLGWSCYRDLSPPRGMVRLWMFSDYIRRRPRYNCFMGTGARCFVCVFRSSNVVGGMESPRYPLYVGEYDRRREDISSAGWASTRIGFRAMSGIHLRV